MPARRRLILQTLALAAFAPAAARAQPFPNRPLKLITPFAAGGASDTAARTVAEALSKALGQPVLVENRPGADGAIAAQAVAQAAPDGHTLLWGVSSVVVGTALLQRPAPWDPLEGFTPLTGVGHLTYTLAVHPNVPARSIAELAEHARHLPDAVNVGTGSLGEFMAVAQLTQRTGIRFTRVPYKGGAQLMPDLLAGRLQLHVGPVSLHQGPAREGRLRILAVLQPRRLQALPEVPTLAEAGVAGVEAPTWQALFAPPKTPPEIAARLEGALQRVLQEPALLAQLERQQLLPEANPGAQALAATLRQDLRRWEAFIREYGITQP